MKKILVFLCFVSFLATSSAQDINTGDDFPDFTIRNILNAPVKQLDVNSSKGKYLILNFWGTWCSPCIPEMDSLKVLQAKYNNSIQVIGIANDNINRLKKYLERKPTTVWVASDTSFFLYSLFRFSYVGQSAILDKDHKVVALVRTDSINATLIEKLISGKPITSSAEQKDNSKASKENEDFFNLDSAQVSSVSLRSYVPGKQTMGKSYPNGPFKGRRKSYFNVCPVILYKDAFRITSQKQVRYEVDKKKACDFSNKPSLFCFDLLVPEQQKDSLYFIMQQQLNKLLPFKARLQKEKMPVYLLKVKAGSETFIKPSTSTESSSSFSGQGFNGIAIPITTFADYLANELDLPVVDETGLKQKYDISTENVMRSFDDILAALAKLGLVLEKGEREMDMLVFYE